MVTARSMIKDQKGISTSKKNGKNPTIANMDIEIIIIMLNGRSIFDLKVTMSPLFSVSNCHCTKENKKSHTLGLGMAFINVCTLD